MCGSLGMELIFIFVVSDGRNGVSPCDQFDGGITRMQFNNFCQGRKILMIFVDHFLLLKTNVDLLGMCL